MNFTPDITDPSLRPTFDFSESIYKVNEDGRVVGSEITIKRTKITTGSATVDLQLSNGSATADDFVNQIRQITFGDSQTEKNVLIPIMNDRLVEGDEYFTATLINPQEGTFLGPQNTATIEIIDDDVPEFDLGGNDLASAAKILPSTDAKTYSDWVGNADRDDYYKFSLGTSNDFNLSLDGLSTNANVALLDSNGTVITSSTNSGDTAESISRILEHGSYYLQVSSVNGANTLYDLKPSFTPLLNGVVSGGSDAPVYTTAAAIPQANNPAIVPQVSQSSTLIGLDEFRADPRFAGINGQSFAVVILDTGIDRDHPFFGPDGNGDGVADRIVYSYDFGDDDANASDFSGHGSNVSSIALSSDGTHTGMAPGANIIHLKVFDDGGGGSFANVEQALQWVIANVPNYKIASLNMSLSDDLNFNTPQQRYNIDDELAALAAQNVIVSASSGNAYFDHNSVQGIAYPSADANSLSIGAVYDSNIGGQGYTSGAIANGTGADRITPFSQRHETLTTVFAPGAPITGADANGGTNTLHGTSQAAPHIAGIAALAQQLAERELGRQLTPAEFTNILKSTAETINDGDDENDNVTNTGLDFKRVDMLALAEEIFVNNPPVLTSPPLYRQGVNWTENPALRGSLMFTFAENTFTDRDIPRGDSLTYTATWLEGAHKYGAIWGTQNGVTHPVPNNWDAESSLPPTINFDPATRTFTIHPSLQGDIWIRVTATDLSGASTNDYFHIYRRGDGIAIDNYIAGGTAFFDANKNGVLDENEPFAVTNELGEFDIDIDLETFDTNNNNFLDPEEGRIVIAGGTDVATGLPLATPIYATPNTFSVTMLTSVAAELVDRGLTPNEAENIITESLSISNNFPIADFDPVAATEDNVEGAGAFFAEMIKVQNTVTQIASLIDGAGDASIGELTPAALAAIANEMRNGGTLDLNNSQSLESIIQDSATEAQAIDPNLDLDIIQNVTTSAAQIISESNQRISEAANNNTGIGITTEVARVQKVTMGQTTSDLKDLTLGNKTVEEVLDQNTGFALDAKIAVAVVYSDAPTDIELTNSSVIENMPVGTAVGRFSTIDTEIEETHTYSLVAGPGDADNDSFQIIDDILRTSETFDYETKNEYSIRVQTADGNGGVYWENFNINVTDVNETTAANDIKGDRYRNRLVGSDGNDSLTGFQGRDTLTGGDGNDQFIYKSIVDAGDIITDFEVGKDKIVLTDLLTSFEYNGSDPIADRYISFGSRGSDTMLLVDSDGIGGGRSRPFLMVEDVSSTALNNPSNFVWDHPIFMN